MDEGQMGQKETNTIKQCVILKQTDKKKEMVGGVS